MLRIGSGIEQSLKNNTCCEFIEFCKVFPWGTRIGGRGSTGLTVEPRPIQSEHRGIF